MQQKIDTSKWRERDLLAAIKDGDLEQAYRIVKAREIMAKWMEWVGDCVEAYVESHFDNFTNPSFPMDQLTKEDTFTRAARMEDFVGFMVYQHLTELYTTEGNSKVEFRMESRTVAADDTSPWEGTS